MIPAPVIAAGLALGAGYVWHKHHNPQLQSLRTSTPQGVPAQIVVPVLHPGFHLGLVRSGVSATPVLPANQTPKVSRAIHLNLHFGKKVNPTTPAIITPGGASNFHVSTNSDVQRALNTLGYAQPPLTIDGQIGPLSQLAIKKFQVAKNMTPTGQTDAATKLNLEIALVAMGGSGNPLGTTPQVQNPGSTPLQFTIASDSDVQHALNILGASPQLKEDGKIGPLTVAAIKAFQIAHQLVADGVAGPQTKTALVIALGQQQSAKMGCSPWGENPPLYLNGRMKG